MGELCEQHKSLVFVNGRKDKGAAARLSFSIFSSAKCQATHTKKKQKKNYLKAKRIENSFNGTRSPEQKNLLL